MKICFTKRAKRDLEQLEKAVLERIKKKLSWYLDQNNPTSFADKLTDFEVGEYRFRIGDYRIIFEVKGDLITVHRVGHRKDIYRP